MVRTYARSRQRRATGKRKRASSGAYKRTTRPRRRGPKAAVRSTKRSRRPARKPQRRGATKAAAELSVFHDPFSKLCQQPRIPDGKSTASLGIRQQTVSSQLVNYNDSNGLDADTMHIVLFPGISSNVLVYNTPTAIFGGHPTNNRDFEVFGYDGHAPFGLKVNEENRFFKNDPLDSTENGVLENLNQIAKWRLVSAGLNLKLVNNDESNDGWFECVRINNCMAASDYMLTTMNNVRDNEKVVVCPSLDLVRGLANSKILVNEKSYQTGLLKDIHKHIFSLHPVTDQVEFKDMFDKYKLNNVKPDDYGEINQAVNDIEMPNDTDEQNWVAKFGDGSNQAKQIIDKMFCQNHDMVYIRIHGRSSGGGSDKSSKLLVHGVGNYEVMYDVARDLSNFHVKGENHAKMDDHYQAKKSSTAAADVVMSNDSML